METSFDVEVEKVGTPDEKSKVSKDEPGKIKKFFKKYFLEGQKLNPKQAQAIANLDENAPLAKRLMVKHRKEIGIIVPFLFFQIAWWCLAIRHDYFSYFGQSGGKHQNGTFQNGTHPDTEPGSGVPNYVLSITMVFGAMIGGMTSEGGGAVAYPVMTLALQISSGVARDFSLMIQACGLSAAAFTILWMKIKLEWHSIIFCSLGAVFGLIFGIEVVDGLSSPTKKMTFVCIFFTFAFALFLLNREHKRKTYDSIRNFGIWQGVVLVCTGFFGGIFSGISGSGVDICSFSMLCLLFRVSEKVSTPTSIVLMAINTSIGFFWRGLMDGDIHDDAWAYFTVCVPIVVFFAPVGSFLSSYFHRQVLAALIYILDTVALITAFAVIRPFTTNLIILSACLLIGGSVFFFVISKVGQKLMQKYEAEMAFQRKENDNSVESLNIASLQETNEGIKE